MQHRPHHLSLQLQAMVPHSAGQQRPLLLLLLLLEEATEHHQGLLLELVLLRGVCLLVLLCRAARHLALSWPSSRSRSHCACAQSLLLLRHAAP